MVLELAYFLGLSCEEIAEVVECPVGTVKTRMFYGRERLKQVLVALASPEKRAAEAAGRDQVAPGHIEMSPRMEDRP